MDAVMVCHCNRVCDTEVNAAIDAGARTVAEVGDVCRAGTCCGSCWPTIELLLARRSALAADVPVCVGAPA